MAVLERSQGATAGDADKAVRRPLAPEGEGGFSQSWYPVCRSVDVQTGEVKGYQLLDGRVVAFRGADGNAQVLSAYCPHMGADLASGDVVGNELRCAFHHWTFERSGRCTAVRVGDPVPPSARLFRFPTQEKYGLIWAFNGAEPLFNLPDFGVGESELLVRAERHSELPHDPAIGVAGAFDMQHFWAVHEFEVDLSRHYEEMEFHEFHVRQTINARIISDGTPVSWAVDVYGPNIIFMTGTVGDSWHGHIAASTQRAPGRSELYMITAVKREDGPELLEMFAHQHDSEAQKDVDLLKHARFTWGTVTRTDRALGAWFAFMRRFPRAHPAKEMLS